MPAACVLRWRRRPPPTPHSCERVVGSATTDAPPHAVLTHRRRGAAGAIAATRLRRPVRQPLGRRHDALVRPRLGPRRARVTAGEAVLGGAAAGYRRWVAVRNSMLFVLARLLLAQDRFLLHGAAVRRDERALLVVGESGAGKSSLAYAAHLAGWQVLGDDMVAVEAATAGCTRRGIPRVPTIPGDVAAGADGEPLPNDPPEPAGAAATSRSTGAPRRSAACSICRHDDGPGRLRRRPPPRRWRPWCRRSCCRRCLAR